MPHPSEPKINIRVQTRAGETANAALQTALDQLAELCEHIEGTYDAALVTFDERGGSSAAADAANSVASSVIPASDDLMPAASAAKKKSKRKSEAAL
jgi:hypothetical protein